MSPWGRGFGEGSSWPPGGPGPALPPRHPCPGLGGLTVGPGGAHPTHGVSAFSSFFTLGWPLETRTELPPFRGPPSPFTQALDLSTQEAFQKIPPATPTGLCSHVCAQKYACEEGARGS